jgi:L-alanine-DL-glutamate epimerase-like enolase superfamily enzyme
MRKLKAQAETWPLAKPFAIARGTRTEIHVVKVTIEQDGVIGRGECFPHSRYSESIEGTLSAIRQISREITNGADKEMLQDLLPAGAARNAVDCALWDLETKLRRTSVWMRAGLTPPKFLRTVMTIGLDSPGAMGDAAAGAVKSGHTHLKVKLGGSDGQDPSRITAVRRAAPKARIIVDANEGWQEEQLTPYLAAMAQAGIDMVEQPLPAGKDGALARIARPLPVGADESVHTRADLENLKTKYDVINIKLDKTGGLTEALALCDLAKTQGFDIMTGCMLGTSLAMAPAMLIASQASYVDLDGPLWLSGDRTSPIIFEAGQMNMFTPGLWGGSPQ